MKIKKVIHTILIEYILGGFLFGCFIGLLYFFLIGLSSQNWNFHVIYKVGIGMSISTILLGIFSELLDRVWK